MRDLSIPFSVQRMEVRDIPQIMAIEKESFPNPWPSAAYRHELTRNDLSHYFIARRREPPSEPSQTRWLDRWLRKQSPSRPLVIGYGGFWIRGSEAHISTLAVRPDWRGQGVGELLLVSMIESAASLNAQIITLEVRISNTVAQNLYSKYLFQETGRRRRYYRDNNEDALSMSTPPLDDPRFLEAYRRHRTELYDRLRNLENHEPGGEKRQRNCEPSLSSAEKVTSVD